MSPDNEEVYIMQDTDEEWVSPTPARAAIVEALVSATDLEEKDLQHIGEQLDHGRLEAVLSGEDGEETFGIEDYEVTVNSSGDISVSE
jgi:hypothetical protein